MEILFLSSWFPSPPTNGAKIRIHNQLHQLTQNHRVTLCSFYSTLTAEVVARELPNWQARCRDVTVMPFPTERPTTFRENLSPYPRSLVARHRDSVLETIRQIYQNRAYDWVIASEVGPATGISYYAGLLAPHFPYPHLLDALEVQFYLDACAPPNPIPRRWLRALTWRKTRTYLNRLLHHFAVCTVPSQQEYENITRFAPKETRVAVVPHSLDMTHLQPTEVLPEPNTLVYVGSLTYAPNADAVQYFLEQIFPLVLQQVPSARLQILGAIGDFAVEYGQRMPVQFVGLREDVRATVQASRVAIVPLRAGSGTRLKIVESLALGVPIVTTSKGMEGLLLTPDRDLLLANDPKSFAQQVVRVLQDDSLWQQLRQNGRKQVQKHYAREAVGRQFEELLTR